MEQAFPAADEIARFVVGLGLINNEWHRTMKLMPKDDPLDVTDDEHGIRLMLARQQAATCHEAIDFIANARHHYPKIGEFIDSLSDEAKEHYRQFNEAADSNSPYYLPWLREHRHVTLHVPELHPERYAHGKDAIANALGGRAARGRSVPRGQRRLDALRVCGRCVGADAPMGRSQRHEAPKPGPASAGRVRPRGSRGISAVAAERRRQTSHALGTGSRL